MLEIEEVPQSTIRPYGVKTYYVDENFIFNGRVRFLKIRARKIYWTLNLVLDACAKHVWVPD